jgi:hypothetical protein
MKTTPAKQTVNKQYDLEVGKFTFYPNIIICEFKEGVHVTFENSAFPMQLAQMAFGVEIPVVYISHRTSLYSWDPVRYQEVLELFPNIIALAMVAENKKLYNLAMKERQLVPKPIALFDNMNSCLDWAKEMLSHLD